MFVAVVTPPADSVVLLAEAKRHLRVDDNSDDLYIAGLIEAVTAHLDGPAGWLGRALITQTLEMRLDGFCSEGVRLPYPPVTSIESVKYDDGDGVEQTLSASAYRTIGSPNAPTLALKYGQSWPSTRSDVETVRIRYIAGYGASGDLVPAPIRHAMLLLIGHLYENREQVVIGQEPVEMPWAAEALLSPYRLFA